MEELKPNAQRAKNAIILVWIVTAIEIVSFISTYFQYDLLQSAAHGGSITMDDATANDNRERIVAALFFISYVISGVTFIQWFRRAYYNLHIFLKDLKNTEGWAAGCWFVPIVCLYMPYQIMKEIYVRTEGLLKDKGLLTEEKFSLSLLGWWWTIWIVNNFAGQIVFHLARSAKSIDDFIDYSVVSMISNLITIPLALITVKLIKEYSKKEELLNFTKDGSEPAIPVTESVQE